MGQLRSIRVFVMGDVNRPGSYVVSSLATISSALYRSGGISEVGTLRDIQLKRQGRLVTNLDLYDLLLNGDTSDDEQLQQGDVIFVPPIGTTIGIGGEVRRPAIYETRRDLTLGAALRLAGGLSAEAYPEGSTLERIGDNRQRRVLSVDLNSDAGRAMPVQSGDTLMIPRVLPDLTDTVTLEGHVYRPGPYGWRPGMRLSELIPSLQALRAGADPNYVLIRRETGDNLTITSLSADLARALAAPQTDENVRLQARDTVHVFDLAFGRQRVIEPILLELKQQATYDAAYEEVRIAGQVRAPGAYPLHPGMRISDLLRAGGNLDETAFTEEAELTRFTVIDGEYREKEVVPVDLAAVLRGDVNADTVLSAYDHLRISPVPDWNSDWSVTLEGEVRFPGEYQILRGETLSDVMARAGGLTNQAFPEGAVFLREELRQREQEQIERLIRRMESDLASLSLQTAETTGAETLDLGQSLLNQLRETEATGRLVIDVEQVLSKSAAERRAHDLELKDGDRLLIPGRSQSVTVLGEAQYPASHLFSPDLDRDGYIAKSGGLTRQADKGLIYVVRASGAVESGSRSRWFSRGVSTDIRPGDTIVVPLDTDRMRPLTFWGNVTQILYQGAIAIAAVRTFDN
jgi:protein involved in polysaccharide export with SLBB domain